MFFCFIDTLLFCRFDVCLFFITLMFVCFRRFRRYCDAWSSPLFRAALRCVQKISRTEWISTDLFPLFPARLLPRPSHGHSKLRGLQGCPTSSLIFSSIHIAATTYHGILKGTFMKQQQPLFLHLFASFESKLTYTIQLIIY